MTVEAFLAADPGYQNIVEAVGLAAERMRA
jgi:hypothetical protein